MPEYKRSWLADECTMHYDHVHVWEASNGPLPQGCVVHHVNGDKHDNRLCNLKCLTYSEHVRTHRGWVEENGEWVGKPCGGCGNVRPLGDFTPRGVQLDSLCRPCRASWAREYRNRRKEEGRPVDACRGPRPQVVIVCEECGGTKTVDRSGRLPRFCGQGCRTTANWRAWRERNGKTITPQALKWRAQHGKV